MGRFARGAESGGGVRAPNSPLRAGVIALVEAQAARKKQAGKAETEPLLITPARGPPLWDGLEAQAGKDVEPLPDWADAC